MNLSHGTQHRVDFMRGGRECLGMFIVHCCLLIYYIAVVMDGAEGNNLCGLVHCAYDGKEQLHLCIAILLSGYLLHGSSHGTRHHAALVMEKK